VRLLAALSLLVVGAACVAAPCVDYSVHVTGKVLQETGQGEFTEIFLEKIPVGAMIFVWTTGVVLESYPGQVEARRVVIRYEELRARKDRQR